MKKSNKNLMIKGKGTKSFPGKAPKHTKFKMSLSKSVRVHADRTGSKIRIGSSRGSGY